MSEHWILWELMGATDGRTRGRMTKFLEEAAASPAYRGWELVQKLSSVGSDGHWPHVMGLWRAGGASLAAALEAGWEDGLDEERFAWGKSKLYSQARGGLRPDHTAFLFEYLVADDAAALASLAGPDLVLVETLAPWQGVAIWGAADLFALTEREWQGIGCAGAEGIREATGWWAVRTPDRDIV